MFIKVKHRETFTEEDGNLINKFEMYKYHLNEGWNSLCSSYEYGNVMLDLTAHKNAAGIYQLNF